MAERKSRSEVTIQPRKITAVTEVQNQCTTHSDDEEQIASESNPTSGIETINTLAECLATTMKTRRPALEPPVFKGEVLLFWNWKMDCDAYIESEGLKGRQALCHLKKYVDEAQTCIMAYFTTNTDE